MKVTTSTYERIPIHYIVQYLYRTIAPGNFSIVRGCQNADFASRKIVSTLVRFPCAAVDL